jgi:hypothetical protein
VRHRVPQQRPLRGSTGCRSWLLLPPATRPRGRRTTTHARRRRAWQCLAAENNGRFLPTRSEGTVVRLVALECETYGPTVKCIAAVAFSADASTLYVAAMRSRFDRILAFRPHSCVRHGNWRGAVHALNLRRRVPVCRHARWLRLCDSVLPAARPDAQP